MSWTDSILESFNRLQNGVGEVTAKSRIRALQHANRHD